MTSDPAEDKARARAALLQSRAERIAEPGEDGRRPEALLALSDGFEGGDAATIAAYVSFGGEPSTLAALEAWRRRGARVLLPVVLPGHDMEFRVYDGTLVPGRRGMACPPPSSPIADLVEASVVVVPALACDRAGRRLGRGAGYYDRVLPRASDTALTVGLVHPEELWSSVPVEDHDQRVRAVLAGHALIRSA